MKSLKPFFLFLLATLAFSCISRDNGNVRLPEIKAFQKPALPLMIDKGFSEYISGYTSGVIPSRSAIEIRFTPEFAARCNKTAMPLFDFKPELRGKTEWKDEVTLVFTPARPLESGRTYTGTLNLSKMASVQERLSLFPIRIQTMKKDFRVTVGSLEASGTDSYKLSGEISTSDIIDASETERYLKVKSGRKELKPEWDHSSELVHRFVISGIERKDKEELLEIQWNGQPGGVKQKGSLAVAIPRKGEFRVLSIKHSDSQDQKVDVVFSDPVDGDADNEGLFSFNPPSPAGISVNSNIVSLFPAVRFSSTVQLTVDKSVRNTEGRTLGTDVAKDLDFTVVPPSIELAGKGVIVPSSDNLVFPFRAASLKAVDLKIIKIYENNLPWFLQESDLDRGYGLKRFGRPVWSGRVDLVKTPDMSSTGWNLHTIDLSDYINVEPGVLYKITLGMRRSYSLFPCAGENSPGKYEELLDRAAEITQSFWDDPEGYFDDEADEIYYNSGFNWRDRDNPCLDAYYSPDRKVTGTILASNFGIIAKMGEDKIMNVIVSDLITALPVNEASVEIFDYQLQPLAKGATSTEGTVALRCERKPFLVIVKKDKDRNYLRTNDGSSLSMSSFDVGGARPEKGIKAYVFGERDVWRPGDSIFLSIFVKDMRKELPAGHPVEFELFNPLDQRVDNQVQSMGTGNLLVFTSSTTADAMTGNYRAVFRIGGAVFTKKVRVETIKPNRLKISLSFPSETLGGKNAPDRGTLNARWLSGSKVSGFRASVEYILRHTATEFKGYSQYTFDDPVTVFMPETVSLFNSTLDGEGNASLSFRPQMEAGAPGMLNAVFTSKVMEPGGDESISQTSFSYAPYSVFAGMSLPDLRGKERTLFTDRENTVKIVTLDAGGKPVSSSAEIAIYRLEYKWWWETDQENLGYFISNNIYKPVKTQTVKTPGGEASYSFSVDKKDWGRYLVRVTAAGGHSTGRIVLIDWPWEYGMKASSTGATMLSVSTDKEKYAPGDEVRLSFPSPANATAIVTIENATGVLEQYRSVTGPGSTEVRFRAKPGMAPNVYASVTVIQPHAQSVNDMPVRLYGVVPVMIEDRDTRLSPVIGMDDEVRSMKPFVIKVSEANGKPMNYVIAVVDEGLLDITSFRTPDPWNHFFAREALGVKTWDLYDYVLGAFGGTLDRLFSVGGDEAVIDRSAGKAQRFKPVVRLLGPFALEPGKTRSHAVTLPQYTGSVRTMVIAGNDNAFGSAEKTVTVSDPLMVLVTAPRVVSPGDRVALPVTLFVKKSSIRDVTLKVTSNDLVTLNQSQLTVNTGGKGEKEAQFEFTAGSRKGIARISLVAEGDGERAVYDLEIDVRSPEPPETRSETRLLRPGEKWETSVAPLGMEGSSSAVLESSQLPSVNLEKWSNFLLDYPHYCSEQVVSAAFPQLLNGSAEGSKAVSSAIGVLISRQMYSGGLALWPGSAQPDTWVTSYAGHFVAEAERAGYSIPQDFRQKWIKYQSELAREWKYDPLFRASAIDQSYRLFTMALAGSPDRGAMNRLRETVQAPALSKWLLAAAYAVSGRPEAATGLIDVRNMATETDYYNSYFGSSLRDKAVILYTLTLLGNNEEALRVVTELSSELSSESWYSTQSVSWGLFAWTKWSKLFPMGGSGGIQAGLTLNGAKTELKAEQGKRLRTELELKKGNNTLAVENKSQNPLHVTLTRKGVPEKPLPAVQEKGLSMKISYVDRELKPVNEKSLTQGSDFIMVARITNTSFAKVGNLALTQMVPAGWEIRNTRLFEASYGISESPYDYRDIRDDRICTYFGLNPGEQKTFIMLLTPAYRGEFSQPSVWCEAMYTPGYYSGVPGSRVVVSGIELE